MLRNFVLKAFDYFVKIVLLFLDPVEVMLNFY